MFEEINNKYNYFFHEDTHCNKYFSPSEIINLFNFNFIPENFIKRAEKDPTGIIYTLFGVWFFLVEKDYKASYYYYFKGIKLNCILAYWDVIHISEFNENFYLPLEKKLEYAKIIYFSRQNFKGKYYLLFSVLYIKHCNTLTLDKIEKLSKIIDAGIKNGDILCLKDKIEMLVSNMRIEEAKKYLDDFSNNFSDQEKLLELKAKISESEKLSEKFNSLIAY
uniref:Uncharacterized protein n=1 Tax=viral metagenome TaxID=1070528 RepID=A0A6C0AGC5_9ZZZZ